MAVTKIKAIRGTLSKAIAYILNPEKTDEKLLVSSYGCASETAAREFEWTRRIAEQKGMNPVRIIARHVIQSFEIGEVTPELAHEIGVDNMTLFSMAVYFGITLFTDNQCLPMLFKHQPVAFSFSFKLI